MRQKQGYPSPRNEWAYELGVWIRRLIYTPFVSSLVCFEFRQALHDWQSRVVDTLRFSEGHM